MLNATKDKLLLGFFAVFLIIALGLIFIGILFEAFICLALSIFALFLYSQIGDKTSEKKKRAFKLSVYLAVFAGASAVITGALIVFVFSQLGNTDVRWQNHYFKPKFSYGYLSFRQSDTEYPLYSLIDSTFSPLDSRAQDCSGNCQSGRTPYLSTRSADCTQANSKDANDINCASKDFQIIKRHDGKKQWAYLGKLLYYYPNRERYGSWWQPNQDDITSKNEKAWRPIQSLYFYNDVLVNSAGKTVYQSLSDLNCSTSSCSEITPLIIENEYMTNIRNAFIFNETSINEKQKQWTFYKHPLFTSMLDKSVGDVKGLENNSDKLEIIKFQPGFVSEPSEKYMKGSEKQLVVNKKYYFNFRGQFLVIPHKDKDRSSICAEECKKYFVPYLVEEDSTKNTSFGLFSAKPVGNDQLQWFYRNEPVFVVVNSYGWPMLDELARHKMQLISP